MAVFFSPEIQARCGDRDPRRIAARHLRLRHPARETRRQGGCLMGRLAPPSGDGHASQARNKTMLTRIAIALAAGSLLVLGAMTPALADIANCMKYPNADTCPTMGAPTPAKAAQQAAPRHLRHTHYRYAPSSNQNKG
jgi:hypothetical protein